MMAELDTGTDGNRTVRKSYLYFVAVVAAVGGFIFGYDLSIIAGASLFLKEEFALTPLWLGFAVSSAVIGCIIGPLAGGGLTDRWGRKKALYLCAILFGVSAIGTALPRTMLEFYIFRILGGMGVGLASIVSPMYIAEVAPARMRGRLVLVNQLAIVVGSLSSIIVSYFLSLSGSWRWMFASELVPILVLLIGLTFIPESPRWFAQKNRREEARGVLTRIGGPQHADSEMEQIARSLRQKTGSFADLFRPGLRTALLIAFTLAVLQQFSGTSPLLFHTPLIFQRAGFENISDAILQSIIVNLWNLTWTAIGLWAVDRFGRRPLLLTGTTVMAIGFALMGTFFYFDLAGLYLLLTMFPGGGGLRDQPGSAGLVDHVRNLSHSPAGQSHAAGRLRSVGVSLSGCPGAPSHDVLFQGELRDRSRSFLDFYGGLHFCSRLWMANGPRDEGQISGRNRPIVDEVTG